MRWRTTTHHARIGSVFSMIVILVTTVGAWQFVAPGQNLPRASAAVASNTADFKPDVIYQVMLDRFFDGDSNNNDPSGDQGLYDSTKNNWKLYWGGDLAGLTQKIPYIAGMGVTAVWISPPVDNTHLPVYTAGSSAPNAGYHGYWARDFYKIDPHLGTWGDFDTLVTTAHNNNVKIVIDFAPNHSNPNDTGEYGSLYKNGTFQAAYNNDPNGWFHHNPAISNYDNLYQDEYYSLSNLSDLSQENNSVDNYLKGAMAQFLAHNVDGVRVDAVKHMPGAFGGWNRTLTDAVEAQGPHYMIGEWYLSSINDPTYNASVEFANHSGISLLNFPLNVALRDVYARNQGASVLDSVLNKENSDFTWLNDQGAFIDNHDMPRFLSLNGNYDRLHEALAVTLTAPGIPIIYYGTEQYLHNDTSNGMDVGGDPYNRPQMTNFSTTTTAYNEIKTLANLRHNNPALAYGTYQQRWVNNDVFIFERQFYNNVVLIAVNKGSAGYTINNLHTSLPNGSYSDVLGSSLHGGTTLAVNGGAANSFLLGANQVSVWQYTASENSTPAIGSIGPNLSRPGDTLIIDGQGFGSSGSVQFGNTSASITNWSAHQITVKVPTIAGGLYDVKVCTSTCSNLYKTRVASAAQVAVTFTVNSAYTQPGDNVYLSGQFDELGNWGTGATTIPGPLNNPNYPSWFIMASVPACWTMQFKFLIIHANGSVQWENGSNHSYTAPCSGTGYVNVNWQN